MADTRSFPTPARARRGWQPLTAGDLRGFLRDYLDVLARRMGVSSLDVDDDTNLLELGLIDSLGFIELILAVEERFGISLRLDERDPADFTTFGGFVRSAIPAPGTS